MAYRLELPPSSTIHPVFLVSQVKKAVGNTIVVQPLPPILSAELDWNVEPEDILAERNT